MGAWIYRVAGAALLAGAGVAAAQQVPGVPAVADLAGQPIQQAIGADDPERRMTVPVSIAEHGPFPFVIDTGAERTVISRELAGILKLAPGPRVMLTAMSGTSQVDTVLIPSMHVSAVGQRDSIQAPALASRDIGAPGLVGLDALADRRLAIDFEAGSMTVTPAERRPSGTRERAAPDEIVVSAQSRLGQLIVSDAWFQDQRVRVILDTGSAVTVGNRALMRQVSRRLARPMQPITLTSVTGDSFDADYTRTDAIKVGGVVFQGLPIAFVEVAPFRRFGLDRKPALMLGMDALRAFRTIAIDFPNREVRFGLPRRRTVPARPILD